MILWTEQWAPLRNNTAVYLNLQQFFVFSPIIYALGDTSKSWKNTLKREDMTSNTQHPLTNVNAQNAVLIGKLTVF